MYWSDAHLFYISVLSFANRRPDRISYTYRGEKHEIKIVNYIGHPLYFDFEEKSYDIAILYLKNSVDVHFNQPIAMTTDRPAPNAAVYAVHWDSVTKVSKLGKGKGGPSENPRFEISLALWIFRILHHGKATVKNKIPTHTLNF